jgi:hypothetical protein
MTDDCDSDAPNLLSLRSGGVWILFGYSFGESLLNQG